MNDDEEIIYAMRIAKEKIEELRAQLATNHERAEEIIRAREATIAELRERLDSETARANELDAVCGEIKQALDEMGAPVASAIGCRLLVSSERVRKLGSFVHPLSPLPNTKT